MTKEEMLKAIEELVDNNGTLVPDKLLTLKAELIKDYDDITTVRTTNKTITENLGKLEAENKELKEANLKLFMMGFKSTPPKEKDPDDSDPNKKPDTPPATPEDIVNTMFGIQKGE